MIIDNVFISKKNSINENLYRFLIMRAFVFVLIVTIATVVISEPDDLTKSRLRIFKCCRYGEELINDDANSNALPRCVPTKNKWKTFIFSVDDGVILDEPPANWYIIDDQRPKCDNRSELVYVPNRHTNPFVMFINGKVVLEYSQATKGPYIPPSHYCSDTNALLVCMPKKSAGNHAAATMRPRVRRCCGENASFHEGG